MKALLLHGGLHGTQEHLRFRDLSGEEIAEGKGAKIRITFADARKGSAELDVTDEVGRGTSPAKAERPDDAVGGPRPSPAPGGGTCGAYCAKFQGHLSGTTLSGEAWKRRETRG